MRPIRNWLLPLLAIVLAGCTCRPVPTPPVCPKIPPIPPAVLKHQPANFLDNLTRRLESSS